jgi:hypothetical protein
MNRCRVKQIGKSPSEPKAKKHEEAGRAQNESTGLKTMSQNPVAIQYLVTAAKKNLPPPQIILLTGF